MVIAVLVYVRYIGRGQAVPCTYTWRFNIVPHLNGNRYMWLVARSLQSPKSRSLEAAFSLQGE